MKTQAQTKKSKRNYIIVALIVVLLLLGVGYAAFSETLTISGNVEGSATWDVRFLEGSDGTISEDGHTLTVTTNLQYPGDQQKITAIIGNKSSVGIKLTNLTVKEPDTSTGIKIKKVDLTAENEKIGVGQQCTYEYVVEWDPDSKETNVNGTYTFEFQYEQDTKAENLQPFHRNHTTINE